MARTILILGTDPGQCEELSEILRMQVADATVTTSVSEVGNVRQFDSIILSAEAPEFPVLYGRLQAKLEEQSRRADLMVELVRLFSSELQVDAILESIVTKST